MNFEEDVIVKYCPKCGSGIADEATFCPACGSNIGASAGSAPGYNPNSNPNPNPGYAPNPGYKPNPNPGYAPNPGYKPAPAYNPADHTAEYDAKDIADNKLLCMQLYLAGYIGIIVALLMKSSSKCVEFHLKQAQKVEVTNLLYILMISVPAMILESVISSFLGYIPLIGNVITLLFGLIAIAGPVTILVVKIISFFQICGGKVKEPAIVRSLNFLK